EALAGLGVPVTLSAGPSPEFREVERGITAVVNSGLRPPAGSYLGRLRARLGERTSVRIMTSEAGLCSAGDAALEPARLLVSGPAAGVVAARAYGDAAGEPRLLSLDMGGTSTDVAFLDAGLPRAPSLEVAGLTIRLPSLQIHTVGAGGGSLAELDEGGALRVGPESAGADPGPAAYGKSDRLTVTDAHLLLGHIAPELFAGGAASLHFDHALAAAERLARRA